MPIFDLPEYYNPEDRQETKYLPVEFPIPAHMKQFKIKWKLGKLFGGSTVWAKDAEDAKKKLLTEFPNAEITSVEGEETK